MFFQSVYKAFKPFKKFQIKSFSGKNMNLTFQITNNYDAQFSLTRTSYSQSKVILN